MGVYNPLVEMPKSCIACYFRYCCPLSSPTMHGIFGFKHPDCPLIDVKTPHGRLGDLDALKAKWKYKDKDNNYGKAWIATVRRSINIAPTIIEAEGKDNG